jgi:glycosyltransferase involved in cell wall biosynthesis
MGDGKGAATIFRTLKAFNDAGHTVNLVVPESGKRHAADGTVDRLERVRLWGLRSFASSGDRRVTSLPGRVWAKLRLSVLFPLLAARQGLRILRQEKIDVLYGYEVQGVLAVRLLRLLRKLPTVARFQGTILSPSVRSPLRLARKFDHVLALKSSADLYIMTDDGTLGDETLARLNPRSVERLRFWRNGIDLERFQPVDAAESAPVRGELGIPLDAPLVVASSRLVSWKRLDRAIRAWPRVAARRPDARLLIVGDGDERARLERMVKELGLEDSVRFTGAVRQEQVLQYLQAADIFVSVNDLSNAGNPLMEAAACGNAIVTLNNGSTGRLICDGVNGLLLQPDDNAGLARALVRLIEDGDLRQRLQRAARQFALDNFWSWDQRMEAEVQAVADLVASRLAGTGG